jgi:hypothetical protein
MKREFSAIIINSFIFVISIIVSFIILELTLEKFNIPQKQPLRYLFLSNPSIKDQKTSFGFYENITIREVSVVEINNQFCFEYDYLFQTNNIGFVQKKPVIAKKKSIIFIGNSFTQGQGAVPWFYQLEETWQNTEYQIVNLGIMGTGVQQWIEAIQWFSNIAEIKHIYILFLSGDWLRERWYAEQNSGLYFIPIIEENHLTKKDRTTHIYFIDRHMDKQTILKKAEKLKTISKQLNKAIDFEELYIVRATRRLMVNLGAIRRKIFRLEEVKISKTDRYELEKSQKAFKQLISLFGNNRITAIHLPTKEEVIDGKYDYFGRLIRQFIISNNIPYFDSLNICALSKEDFHKYDGHPNSSGYGKIGRLVENLLHEQTPEEKEK